MSDPADRRPTWTVSPRVVATRTSEGYAHVSKRNRVPNPTTVANTIPNRSDRLAADRMMRLAHQAGPPEALAFYDELPVEQRRVVAGVLARAAAANVSDSDTWPAPDDHPEWWTVPELAEAERLVRQGYRNPWLIRAHEMLRNFRARDAEVTAHLGAAHRRGDAHEAQS